MTVSGEAKGGVRVRAMLARWSRAVADLPRWIWFAAAAVVAVLITVIALGGFAAARTETTPAGPEEEVRTSAYAVTVLDAQLAGAVESEYLEAEPGQTLLVLRTRIENLSDTPIGVGSTADLTKANLVNTDRPLIDLVGVTAVDRTAVWRPDGSSGQVFLQPGVPAEVMLAWTIPDDALTGREVSLDVHDAEVSVGAVILSSNVVTWRAGDVVARITVPVEDGA